MNTRKKLYATIAGVALVSALAVGIATIPYGASANQPGGSLDDGKDLLPRAAISLDQAIAAARGAASGEIGEVDLEYWHGTLVFNVDVGDSDVKVDASTGAVLGQEQDD